MDGLRAAASGLAAQQARMDAIANDIANVSTPGYKKERLAFRDLVDRSGAAATEAGRSFLTGPQIANDDPLALAIDGPGFFQVKLGDVTIAADGTVTAGGKKLGQIVLADVPVRAELQSVGGGLYVATTASGAAGAVKDPQIRQGVLEGSNVALGDAMVDLIDAQRSFQLASKALKTQDDLAEIANGIRR